MKKRRQHYVWQHYLDAWTENDQLFCLRNGTIFLTNTLNVGQKRDFYRLQDLTPNDIELIKLLYVNTSPPFLRPLHLQLLEGFTTVFKLKRLYEQSGKTNTEVEKQLDITINNLEENLHCGIEIMAVPFLQQIRKGDISFYRDEKNRIAFNYFVATQYLRTNHMKDRMHQAFQDIPTKYSKFNLDMDRIWNVVSHIIATNIGFSLSSDNGLNLFLLNNLTETPFITGDQPIVNIKADPKSFDAPLGFELYYPQTPHIALLFSTSDDIPFGKNLKVDEVTRLNSLIVASSQEQVYANERIILEQYI